MVKSLVSIAVAALLLLGISLFEWLSVDRTFEEFHEELHVLYLKTEEERANGEDAKSVQTAWVR